MGMHADAMGRALRDYGEFPHPELRLHVEHGDHVSGAVSEHHHVFGELVLIRDGRGTLTVDSREHPLSSGNVIYIASERIHDYHGLEDVRVTSVAFDPVRYLRSVRELAGLSASSMLFGRDWVSPTPDVQQHMEPCVRLWGEGWSSLAGVADALTLAYLRGRPGLGAEVRAWFSLLLITLVRAVEEPGETGDWPRGLLARVLDFVEAHYAEPLTVDGLADVACMSRSSLQRAFRKEVGCAPMEYVMRRRIEHARELLLRTRMSVTAIAERVGFMDSNHFTRRFGRDVGVPPSVYRKYRGLSAGKGLLG